MHPEDTTKQANTPQAEPPTPVSPLSWPARRAFLRRFRQEVVASMDDLLTATHADVGKPRFEALATEIITLLSAIRWHERHAAKALRPRRVRGRGPWQMLQRHRLHRAPLGTVAIIATWNYPIQLLGVQLAQAVAAGNRVIVKPSERSPKSQDLLIACARRAAHTAGLPPGWIDARPATRDAGGELTKEGTFDHLVFTGSTAVGARIAAELGPRLITSTLELSGADTAIVLDDADPALAARSILYALMLGRGATCMAPRRVLATPAACDALCGHLQDLAKTVPPESLATDERLAELAAARTLTEEAVAAGAAPVGAHTQHPPHLVRAKLDIAERTTLFAGEHFGPALIVAEVPDLNAALRVHAAIPKKLATSLFTRDVAAARGIAPRLGSGVVTINDSVIPTGHPGLAITGSGPSGWGSSRGEAGLLAMTRPVHVAETPKAVRTPLDPPAAFAQRGMERFVRWLYG